VDKRHTNGEKNTENDAEYDAHGFLPLRLSTPGRDQSSVDL
jgi:hypothetical protein